MFAERVMDAIAVETGLDPLDVRKRNLYGRGRDVTPYRQKIEDNIALEVIEALEKSSSYRARRKKIAAFNKQNAVLKKGIALTPVKFGISFTLTHLNQAGALVHVYTDGSVHLNHGGTEMGQGLYIKIAQVVAEVFGISADMVRITATTTGKVPNTSPTAASSGSDLNGMAAKIAATAIKGRMIDFAAKEWKVAKSRIKFEKGQVLIGNQRMSFGELAKKAHGGRVSLSSTGFYSTPKITWDRPNGRGNPFFYFAYGASCSEVTIDTMTGEMRVDRVDILHDVGRSLNPAIDMGQIEGGFVQGMGWLTTEELVFDDKGRLRTHAPSTYKIPCASDVPADFRVKLYESGGNPADSIYRSKAVGEPPLMLPISVWCAIADAVGQPEAGCHSETCRAGNARSHFTGGEGDAGMKVWAPIVKALDAHGTCAMISVVKVEGSTPREAGARIVVTPLGFHGTIGGGTLEWQAIAKAQALLGKPTQHKLSVHSLGPDLGQCCGGRVQLVTEVFSRSDLAAARDFAAREESGVFAVSGRILAPDFSEQFGDSNRKLYLFGAGHVGRALILALAPLPFDVIWIDPREGAFPSVVPSNVVTIQSENPAAEIADAPPGSFALVMTHSHATRPRNH